jgi:hypothetical protein
LYKAGSFAIAVPFKEKQNYNLLFRVKANNTAKIAHLIQKKTSAL